MTFPTVVDAAADVVREALETSQDRLVRLDCSAHFAVRRFIDVLDSNGQHRFGLTTPVKDVDVGRSSRISHDPRQITRWRNESVSQRRQNPLVILGRASGRNEAGLRRCRVIISESAVLQRYRRLGETWIAQKVESAPPKSFFAAIVGMALEGLISVDELDDFCYLSSDPPRRAHVEPQKNLWRLGLFPDKRAMDGNRPGVRLSLNYDLREMRVSAPASDAEERRRARLVTAAERGDEAATAAIAFANSRNKEALKNAELDAVRRILEERDTDPDDSPRRGGGFYDALGHGGIAPQLDRIGEDWDPNDEEFSESVEIDGKRYDINFERDLSVGLDDDEEEERPGVRDLAETLYWTRIEGSQTREPFLAMRLLEEADIVDRLAGTGTNCADLTKAFLEARVSIAPLIPWAGNLVELLTMSKSVRERAESYRMRWTALVDFVLKCEDPAHTEQFRQRLCYIDADWEYRQLEDDSVEHIGAQLLPIHPFVLTPCVEIAQYARASLGRPGLGNQLRWAQDRSTPAYPAIWIGNETLLHREGSTSHPLFTAAERVARPPLNTGTGLVHLIRAYVGMHPYAAQSLRLLLVDPPEGGGVAAAIRQILSGEDVERVTVSAALWHAESARWEGLGVDVENLGRIARLDDWLAVQPASHIVVVFGRPRPAHVGGSHSGAGGPSRGLQNALTVTLRVPQRMGPATQVDERVPCVTVQPRDSHDVVQLIMRLTRSSEREDRLFEIRPLLQGAEVAEWASFGRIGEWLAFAAPSPIGLIPPRSLPEHELVYIGREEVGSYALFVYAHDLYAVRRRLAVTLTRAPLAPVPGEVEAQLE